MHSLDAATTKTTSTTSTTSATTTTTVTTTTTETTTSKTLIFNFSVFVCRRSILNLPNIQVVPKDVRTFPSSNTPGHVRRWKYVLEVSQLR